MLVFGTRPEAIKMAPLVKAFQEKKDDFKTIVCVTGQHREMLDQVLDLFGIKPDFDLNIMKQGQDLYDVTSRVLLGMRDVLKVCRPDYLFVHGDTTTSTAAALAAFYQQIPVCHVEAGLRTYDIYSPWPEEMNRLITGRIATYHFSPTLLSRVNLLKENVDGDRIVVTGNTVIDALHWVVGKIAVDAELGKRLAADLERDGYDVERLNGNRRLVLVTGHRRENFGAPDGSCCQTCHDHAQDHNCVRKLISQTDHTGCCCQPADQHLSLTADIPEFHLKCRSQCQCDQKQDRYILKSDPGLANGSESTQNDGLIYL